MLGGLPGSGQSKDKRDASKSLRAACAKLLRRRQGGNLIICEIHTLHILEMTPLPTNIDDPFLKDRILRLWNSTVSSTRATIVTQLLGKEGLVNILSPPMRLVLSHHRPLHSHHEALLIKIEKSSATRVHLNTFLLG
jgi:hypothetical protein